jgi:hypothetical protein
LASLSNDAPMGGGNWSLELTSDGLPSTGFAYASVNGVQSGDILRLSTFIRATGTPGGGGTIQIRVGPSLWLGVGKSSSSNDTTWTRVTVSDTVALGSGDSVWVVLSASADELLARKGRFDLVQLDRLSQ